MVDPGFLDKRLAAAGVGPDMDVAEGWRRLRATEGARATVIDLYEMAARLRGLRAHELPLDERLALARAAMPEVWPGFEQTRGSERRDMIRVVEYDPEWPRRYDEWRKMLTAALGDVAQRIEHVGSTAVPGLPAKPIIDIQVSVDDLADEPTYVPAVEGLGVQLRSRDDLHRYFRPSPGRPRDVHVHVCGLGSDWEREHLLFRDHLRRHARAREAYAAAKREAVATWADDAFAYTDAKGEVILSIMAEAEAERTDGGTRWQT